MFPLDLGQCSVLFSCVLIALGMLLFGFGLAWGLRNDLQSWGTTILYYGWILLGMCSIFLTPVFLQMVLLTGLWLVSLLRPWNSRRWLQWGLSLTVLAWGFGGYWGYQGNELSSEELKEQYPMVSLAGRIPRPPRGYPQETLSSETSDLVNDLEKQCSLGEVPELGESWTQRSLRVIHDRNRWGFLGGVGMIDLIMSRMILQEGRSENVPKVLQPPRIFSQTLQNLKQNLQLRIESEEESKILLENHQKYVVDFLRPYRFGYVRDIDHVAGFQAHGFASMPKSPEGWNIARLDLVSLLVHEGPVVYQSDSLPRMVEAAKIPTQPLDPWESAAFQQIAEGENLVVAKFTGGMRMMGAIRNARHCTQCHSGNPGDLLGAFAYKLIETK